MLKLQETRIQSLGWKDPFREGNGNPLQYSCLENPRDGGAWWAAVYGVAQSWARLKRRSSSSSMGRTCAVEHLVILIQPVAVNQCPLWIMQMALP